MSLVPAATPVMETPPEELPAGIIIDAGTVTFVTSLLENVTVAADNAADERVAVRVSMPPTLMDNEAGVRADRTGSTGVEPSVVNCIVGAIKVVQ